MTAQIPVDSGIDRASHGLTTVPRRRTSAQELGDPGKVGGPVGKTWTAVHVENRRPDPINQWSDPPGVRTIREADVKYMVIIYGNKDLWESFPPGVAAEAIAQVDGFNRRHQESGELLAAYGLGDELTAKTVRVRDGVPAVTDGPYLEAKEFVSSFFILDCENESRAIAIAAEYPFAAHNAVDVWPILHEAGQEM